MKNYMWRLSALHRETCYVRRYMIYNFFILKPVSSFVVSSTRARVRSLILFEGINNTCGINLHLDFSDWRFKYRNVRCSIPKAMYANIAVLFTFYVTFI